MNTASPDVDLTIALPAYEEAANLKELLPKLRSVLDALSVNYEVLVIDAEAPRDDTQAICTLQHVAYINRTGGPLYSHAVRSAIASARGHWIIFMDADGSHNPDFIPKLWAERTNADLVIASRYVPGGKTENPPVLILMSRIVNIVFQLTLGLPVADVSNSFRLYRREHIASFDLHCEHFDIIEEILVKLCARPGPYRVKEIPTTFEKRKAGKTKRNLAAFAIGYLATILRLRKIRRESAAGRD